MKRPLKWLGVLVGLLLIIVIVFAIYVFFVSNAKVAKVYEFESASLSVTTDSASVARGLHLAQIHACFECHGEKLGGDMMMDAPPFARVISSNLTPGKGGVGAEYSSQDWERAVRHGVRPDGTGMLAMMPSNVFTNLNDEDTAALAAYLGQLDPVDNELPERTLYPIGRMVLATGGLEMVPDQIDHERQDSAPITADSSPEYGYYLLNVTCVNCHGKDLHGASHPDPSGPDGPDLASVGNGSFEEFAAVMRTGVGPSGAQMESKYMPWKAFRYMSDTELTAIYQYLLNLPS